MKEICKQEVKDIRNSKSDNMTNLSPEDHENVVD